VRIAAKVELSEAQRKQLGTWATGRTIPVRLAERAKMILLAAQGKTDKEIGADLGIWRGLPRQFQTEDRSDPGGAARFRSPASAKAGSAL